jgi:hypothetical protein
MTLEAYIWTMHPTNDFRLLLQRMVGILTHLCRDARPLPRNQHAPYTQIAVCLETGKPQNPAEVGSEKRGSL